MAENLPWLFGAFALGWAIVFGYLFWLSGKERALRKRIASLEELVHERGEVR
jgi:CcmD family protein